ncbi:MAG: HAMP domain-containing sensor histidine kinase [Bdellovibrionales bacterium]
MTSFELLDEMHEPVIVVKGDLSTVHFNFQAQSLFQLSNRFLKNVKSINDVADFDNHDLGEMVKESFDHNSVIRSPEVRVTSRRHPKRMMYFVIKSVPVIVDDQKFILLCFKDFTQERLLQDKYNGQVDKIRTHEMISLGELASGVAHEINNPLAIVQLWAERAERKIGGDGNYGGLTFESVFEAVERIRNIVLGLRRLAHPSKDSWSHFNVVEELQESVSYFALVNKTMETVKFKTDFPKEELLVTGDAMLFQRIVLNLLSNARDALKGSKDPLVKVAIRHEDSNVYVDVKDNGCGIPENAQDSIFDSFFTTKKVGFGTGMGLGLVKKSVEELSGEISFTSQENVGTCFTIKFPEAVLTKKPKTPAA